MFLLFVLLIGKDSYHENCFPVVPGGRVSPQKLRPLTQPTGLYMIESRPKSSDKRRPKSGMPPKRNNTTQNNNTLRPNKSELYLGGKSAY